MELLGRLRQTAGLSQSELADLFGVSQPAVSQYESGKRSPNLDAFVDVASQLGRRLILVADRVSPANDRSERFSRLLYLRVAERYIDDPERVRAVARANLTTLEETVWNGYVEEWKRLLEPENETELLGLLCIPDPENTGLLSSSPFAGVIPDVERLELLERTRSQ